MANTKNHPFFFFKVISIQVAINTHIHPFLLWKKKTKKSYLPPFLTQTVTQGLEATDREQPMYPPVAYREHPILDFGAPRFMFYVYGFDLSDRIWLVSLVMTLVVVCLFGCVFSTILAGHDLTYPFVCIVCLSVTWCPFNFKGLSVF
jgi:hypothetical protein